MPRRGLAALWAGRGGHLRSYRRIRSSYKPCMAFEWRAPPRQRDKAGVMELAGARRRQIRRIKGTDSATRSRRCTSRDQPSALWQPLRRHARYSGSTPGLLRCCSGTYALSGPRSSEGGRCNRESKPHCGEMTRVSAPQSQQYRVQGHGHDSAESCSVRCRPGGNPRDLFSYPQGLRAFYEYECVEVLDEDALRLPTFESEGRRPRAAWCIGCRRSSLHIAQ